MNRSVSIISLVCLLAIMMLATAGVAQADTYTDITATFPALLSSPAMDHSGSTWMLGGEGATTAAMYSWNGVAAPTDLSAGLGNMLFPQAINYNGSYWMIGGRGLTVNDLLYKYDGTTFTNIPGAPNVNRYYDLAAIGPNWLIGGQPTVVSNAAATYDGTTFTTTTAFDALGIITAVASNGSVWLLGGNDSSGANNLYSYDGVTANNLSSGMTDMAYVLDIAWNGSYWLIGGCNNNSPRQARVFKYDGATFTDLSSQLNAARSGQRVISIGTNGPTWLLGGYNFAGSSWRLWKYDGAAFTDLTDNIDMDGGVGGIATDGPTWLLGSYWAGGASNVWRLDMSPAVSGISPVIAPPLGTVTLTINGANFGPGTTVMLTKAGQTDLLGTSVVILSASQLSATFDLTGAALGSWDVVATNTGGASTLAGAFTVGVTVTPPTELPYAGR